MLQPPNLLFLALRSSRRPRSSYIVWLLFPSVARALHHRDIPDTPSLHLRMRRLQLLMGIPSSIASPVPTITPWTFQLPYESIYGNVIVTTATIQSWCHTAAPRASFNDGVTRTWVDICRLHARHEDVLQPERAGYNQHLTWGIRTYGTHRIYFNGLRLIFGITSKCHIRGHTLSFWKQLWIIESPTCGLNRILNYCWVTARDSKKPATEVTLHTSFTLPDETVA